MLKNRMISVVMVLAIFICCGTMHCFISDCWNKMGTVAAATEPTATPAPPEPAKIPDLPPTDMTPAQALDVLAQAASAYRGTLQEHIVLRQAVTIIAKALNITPEKK